MSASVRTLLGSAEGEAFLALIETVPDAIVLSDSQGRIALVNNNAERMFGYGREELLGEKVEILMPSRFQARHRTHRSRYYTNPRPRSMGSGLELLGLRKDGTEFPIEISLSPVRMGGELLVWSAIRDVTERENLIAELRASLDEVKQLSGLFSICASCKRIRDERGSWQHVESYIQSHSEATFTHGVCPDCMRKLYPGYEPEEPDKH
jgi:PAS domain S-box-containing protein